MDINLGLFLERLRRVLAGEEFTVPDTAEQPIQNLYTETEIVASWLRDSGYNTAWFIITQQKSQSGCSKDICDALLGLQSKIIDIKQRMQQVQHIHSGIVDELKSIEAKASNFPASSSFKNRDTMGLDNRMEELLDLLIEGPPQLSAVAVLDSIGLDQTAFAAEAYRSNYVKHYFDCHAWVQESLPYDADQILYDIIKFVMPSRSRIEIVASFQFENGENIGLDFVPIGGLLRVTYQGWPFHILYHGIISLNENIEEALDEPRGLQLVAYCMLPFYLKLCCLYLSVFPIHFEICTKQLYQLWIAEGFIPNNNKVIAKKYLEQLINGGFVDAEKRSDIGRINTCSILGRYSPALLTVAFEGEFIISPIMVQEVILRENVKRFTAHEKLNDFAFLDDFDSFLHSLLYLTSGSQYLDPNYCEKICKMFKFLRVLDLGSLVLIRYLSGIQNLFLLRYLKLNIPSFKTLASSLFSSLLNLYTVEMPFSCKDHTTDEFWKMSKLRLSCLESLKLANESKMPRRSNIILAEYQFPPSLTHLSFLNIELMDDPMPALEKLPVLQVLKLKQNAYSGRKLACSPDGFPKLKKRKNPSKQSGKYLSSQSFNFNKNPAVWGIYFDKTSHDEQISGSRIPQTGIFCRSLVAGEHEQEYSARSQMHHPRGHSGSQPPTSSIRPFLLEVEVERLGQ
ncbi:putative disease resistance protein [Citrus sinensis]|nr:putative disease resistance protein [Citrus sinensis]